MSAPSAALLAAAMLTGCVSQVAPGGLDLEPCRLKGLSVEARCGSLSVPEDRSAPDGRRLDLRVVVVPADNRDAAPDALFIIVGGPGQAATEAGPMVAQALMDARRHRDIVLVDQRGTGASGALDCRDEDEPEDALSLTGAFTFEKLQECLDGHDADLRLYTTPHAMTDLDDVRRALGYESINLWGGSYGTRAALVYARMYPERVRSLLLDGAAPLELRLPLYIARDSQLALDGVLERCARDEACATAFPNLGERLDALLERLEAGPIEAEVRHPRTGATTTVAVDRDGLAGGLLAMLYSPQLVSLLPMTISRAADGEFGPLLAQALAMRGDGSARLYAGKLLSVVCAEDIPRFSWEETERLSEGTMLGTAFAAGFRQACDVWPRGDLPAGYEEPVASTVPTLILSGALDPVTPPSWGELAARTLPSSRHIIVPGAAHGVTVMGCVPRLVAEFLEAGSGEALDTACAERIGPPDFFQDFAGPRP